MSKTNQVNRLTTKYFAVCGLCKMPLGKKSKGYKCGYCGALFTNPHVLGGSHVS